MKPINLLDTADGLLINPGDVLIGVWPRAAALLSRQAIELAMVELWRARAPGAELSSVRAQLLLLPTYLHDHELAHLTAYAWMALSRACHHHGYDLPPDVGELRHDIGIARRFASRTAAMLAEPASSKTNRRR